MKKSHKIAAITASAAIGIGAVAITPVIAHKLFDEPGDTEAARTAAVSDSAPSTPGSASGTLNGDDAAQNPDGQAPGGTEAPTASGTVAPGENHAASAESYAYPAADVNAWITEGEKAKNYPKNKIVFLTFDDGPTEQTPKDLAVLKEHGVHATFFEIGKQVGERTAPIVHDVVAQGNAAAIHSYSHDYHYLYPGKRASAEHIGRDYDKALAAMRGVLGKDYHSESYRYPGGHMSWKHISAGDAALKERGVTWIDWSAMTGDAEPKKTRPTTVDGVLKQLKERDNAEKNPNVDVVLMHDARGKTLTTEALPKVIEHYKSQGYEFGIIG